MRAVRCLCLALAACWELTGANAADGYESFPTVQGSRYKLSSLKLTWAEALTNCQEDGGDSHLVVINSDEEAAVVQQLFARIDDLRTESLFVGTSDLAVEGSWRTVEGGLVSASGYNRWAVGEPSDITGNEDCGAVDRNASYHDSLCNYQAPSICEKPTNDGYETFAAVPGSRYRLYTELQTWLDALYRCINDGGALAVPNSQAEADVLAHFAVVIQSWIHVGINDIQQEGLWRNVQGQRVSESGYSRWAPGQPNEGILANCGYTNNGLYNDGNCGDRGAFVCEKPDG